ncbi:MAG: crotonase/enoyl-CoA hydratase family protein [Pseudomonadota bacterium]|nr:crotonase/enoyl-CoA hydratase family protein [Pseudomonadota bacterium]
MSDIVTIDIDCGIADVRLNRPEKYNALSGDMFTAIIEAGESLSSAMDVRVVVLSGNGPGFCAGLDFDSFQGMADAAESGGDVGSGLLQRDERPENRAQRPAYVWKTLPMPVIAAVHGVAYGGGCQIALGADIRIASPEAKFSVMEIKWGIIPDMSITQTLRDVVRLDIAKELTFTGRIVSAVEAERIGLVSHLSEDPLATAKALAAEIAGRNPHAVRASKHLYEKSWHGDAETGLSLEAMLQKDLLGSENQIEAVYANFEKRAPVFRDPQ